MAPTRKRLHIISLDRRVNGFLCNIVQNIVGREVEITGQCMGEQTTASGGADLVLTSGKHLLPDAERLFPGIPVMAPERIITGYNLEKVLMLPKGASVLVVNHPRGVTEETIAGLKNMGINHLNYIPFWHGRESSAAVRRLTTAISPGMTHLCPDHIANRIDIGPRLISMASFCRLLMALDLDIAYLERYANTYHSFLMAASRKIGETLSYVELLAKRNEVILNEFEEGLVIVSAAGHIDRANRRARELLSQDGREILQRPYQKLMADFEKVADLIEPSGDSEKSAGIYALEGQQLVITRIPVVTGRQRSYLYTFREIARIQRLEKDLRVKLARRGYLTKYNFDDIWGKGRPMARLIEKAGRFAKTDKTILITGESGTGKELFAHGIHSHSMRREGPFVAVNFAGLSESLIESELFGYEAGAFTGARKGGKEGLFEQAHGGTIFLDEIGDASPDVQSRLLRVLQERELLRVGGSKILHVDVRVIAATNNDLRQAMDARRFRSDLYYRLSGLPLEIPPLRERPEDILYLFERFMKQRYGIAKTLAVEAQTQLVAYPWPGNVRELINTVDYACITSQGNPIIQMAHLPRLIQRNRDLEAFQAVTDSGALRDLADRICARPDARASTFHILEFMVESSSAGIGRNRLCRLLAEQGISVTEGRMKSLLKKMKNEGLISVGATRQGTVITPKGRAFFDYLNTRTREGVRSGALRIV